MRSRNNRTANFLTSSKTCKKYDYELFRGIMSKELFDYAVACNEYLEQLDRTEEATQSIAELPAVG